MTVIRKEQIESELALFFSARKEVLFAYLFGSVAKESAGRFSDIDIAVYLDPVMIPEAGGYGYQSELIVELQATLKDKVDLVILNEAPTVLKFQVLKSGSLIYCASEQERRKFHENTLKIYLDLKPLLRVQRYYLQKRLAEGKFGGGN